MIEGIKRTKFVGTDFSGIPFCIKDIKRFNGIKSAKQIQKQIQKEKQKEEKEKKNKEEEAIMSLAELNGEVKVVVEKTLTFKYEEQTGIVYLDKVEERKYLKNPELSLQGDKKWKTE